MRPPCGLDVYEDDIWKVFSNFTETDGALPGAETFAGTTVSIRQDVSITSLGGEWLPAAFAPRSVDVETVGVTWNAETGSLITAEDGAVGEGLAYTVESVVPIFTTDEILAASPFVPDDIAERFLALPDDLPEIVETEARRITTDADNRLDQMLALQEHFRAFDYSVRLGARNPDLDPIEQFLDERVGFCQQFAGTFALMARSLGAPARVAVGFTWGDPIGPPDELGRTTYSVSGRQTHAWPEVWFEGLGWVAFEPTPGRGAPGAAAYTGVAAQQDSLVQPDDPAGPTTTTTEAGGDLVLPEQTIPDDFLAEDLPESGGLAVAAESGGLDIPWRLVGLLTAVLAYLLGLPAWQRLRRRRRAARADSAAGRIDAAWADAVETAEQVDLVRRTGETELEFADRLAADRRIDDEDIRRLARVTASARYGPAPSDDDAVLARECADRITMRLRRSGARSHWLRRDLDPRRLWRPTGRTIEPAPAAPAPAPEPVEVG